MVRLDIVLTQIRNPQRIVLGPDLSNAMTAGTSAVESNPKRHAYGLDRRL
jgi:hypothetical protein